MIQGTGSEVGERPVLIYECLQLCVTMPLQLAWGPWVTFLLIVALGCTAAAAM